jgi:hypothetical protein
MNSEQAQKNNTTPRSPASSSKRERKPSKNFDSMIFPQRLMAILADEENHEALSWLPDGRSFAIRDRDLFVETAMPQFCPKKSKFSSFVRKLSRWYVYPVTPDLIVLHEKKQQSELTLSNFIFLPRLMLQGIHSYSQRRSCWRIPS